MDREGIRPGDVRTSEDFALLPLISGSGLADAPERFYSSRYSPSNTLTLQSSGTNGKAKHVRYNYAALFESLAHGHRQRAVMAHFTGRNAEYREMSIVREESISKHLRKFYEDHTWVPRKLDVRRRRIALDLPFEELVDQINDFRPDLLTGYGAHLGALFRWVVEHQREFHRPKLVLYGADAMSAPDRLLIEQEAGIPVISTYQADEALRIGFQCEQRKGFHLSLDDVAVRVIRPEGQPAEPGETGEIVISNLNNRATVLLNYRLGDMVTMPTEPCPCGRSLPVIENIAGRANDMIRLPGGDKRHALIFLAPLQGVPGVSQVQLVQDCQANVRVNVVTRAGSDWEDVNRSVVEITRKFLGEGVEVSARQLSEIPLEPGGKIRAVISHMDDDHAG
jgi:phenylacetate-CoA ligase